ncbi:MAG: PAS domain S-box protein [Candidatus Acidiferrales bacterium]
MISAHGALSGSYDYGEVARSVLVAIAASYAALDLAGRVTAARGQALLPWLSGGAIAMGIGIWAMHFKGMLAFHLPVLVEYYWPTVLASLLVAILASAVALYVASRPKMGWAEALCGGVIMSAGIAGTHYLGMAAMRLPAITRYSPFLVICSILLAILFSLIALLMAFGLREETRWTVPRRFGSAIVMGAAISAMHYTGMAAASFIPAPPPDLAHAVSIPTLGNYGIAVVTLIVLMAAMATSSLDRRTKGEIQRLNQELERRVAERTLQLETVNQSLRREIAERERVEGALRRSEDHLRLVIDTIPQEIWSCPPDGSLDFCNAQFRSYVGLTLEELQGDGWQRMLHPDDRERVTKAWRESVMNGTPFEEEVRHRATDGQYRWFLVRGVPLKDSQGRIVRWYGTNTDIEDRKQAAEHLRLVIDTTPAMLHSARPDGYVDFFNKRWLEYVGVTLEEIGGWRWTNVVHPEDVEDVVGKWRSALAAGKHFETEARLRRADGEYRLMLLRKVPLRDEAGSVVKWYGSAIDIEDRKRAEAELRESEARFRLVADSAPVMIWMSGTDKLCSYFNKPWLDFTGRSIDRELGNGWADGVDPEDLQRCLDTYIQAFDRREAFRMEYRLRRHDGEFRWVSDIGVPRFNSDGSFAGYIGSCIDVTEQRRAEEQLRQAQEDLARVTRVVAMGELAATIAHEVNQPLTAIVTNGNFCLRRLDGATSKPDELRAAITEIVNDGTRASGVISRIRGLLMKESPNRVELDINRIVQDVTNLMRKEFTRNRVSLRTELASDLAHVPGDPVLLPQVLINLIMNAIEAASSSTNERREILIRSAKKADGVLVQVQDSGPPIEPELISRIFEPFFTTKAKGIGLGLSISHSIIESHGGRLWTTPSSTGALFEFTLPTDAADAS